MATVNFNMRLDADLRDRAFPVIERFGLSPAQAFKLFLTQVAATNTLPLSFDYEEKVLTAHAQKRLLESIRQMENGDYTVFSSPEDLAGDAHESD